MLENAYKAFVKGLNAEKVYEGLNALSEVYLIFIQSIFLRNVPNLRVI